jgi:hypothetical protein
MGAVFFCLRLEPLAAFTAGRAKNAENRSARKIITIDGEEP